MKSPFPGMDAYIEISGLWGDFHNALIAQIYDRLCTSLPPGYVARTGERSYVVLVESEEKKEHGFGPDVRVSALRSRQGASSSSTRAGRTAGTATAETEP